jgi:polyisoprenoid-binding protein YceI
MNMKRKIARAALALAALVVLATPALAEKTTFQIDAIHSSVGFKIRHLVSKVPGRFNSFSGTIEVDPKEIASGKVSVEIDVASIDTANERRDGHLKSEDFFAVEEHPKMTFESTKIVDKGDGKAEVHGNLTMKGVTKPVVLDTEVLGFGAGMGAMRAGFEATTTIDRKEFGIVWNRALDAGGVVLGDDVEISINLEAIAKEEEEEKSGL